MKLFVGSVAITYGTNILATVSIKNQTEVIPSINKFLVEGC